MRYDPGKEPERPIRLIAVREDGTEIDMGAYSRGEALIAGAELDRAYPKVIERPNRRHRD